MGALIVIEKWSENLEEVTLNKWLKREGERVGEGDVLCEIITDKITFEYEVDLPGVVRRLYCSEKSTLPVGFTIAFIGGEEETLPAGVEKRNSDLLREHSAKAALDLGLELTLGEAPPPRVREKLERPVRATPAARRVARENEVTIEAVAAWMEGDGTVTEADVESYLEELDKRTE